MRQLFILVLFLVAACAAIKTYSTKGEEIYYEKCGGCHRVYNKNEFTIEEWKKEFEEMSEKAKLNNEEKENLHKFLIADDTK